MTQNQINWAKLQEDIRHNRAGEGEQYRHNLAGEVETNRMNLANESLKKEANAINWGNLSETNRHNQAVETETNRHDVAMEQQAADELNQRKYEYEDTGKGLNLAEISRRAAQADMFNQETITELLKRDQIDLQKQYLEQQIAIAESQGILNEALAKKAKAEVGKAGSDQVLNWLKFAQSIGQSAQGNVMSVLRLFI